MQKPVSLCNPANKEGEDPDAVSDPDHLQAYRIKLINKNGESPGAETHDEHLLCYQIRPAPGELKHVKVANIHTNNQFGPMQVKTVKEEELCVPSLKTLP